jgi:hypothetical protein
VILPLLLLAAPNRGPYLQSGTPTSIVVVWRTDTLTAGVVRYGRAEDDLSGEIRLTETSTRHQAAIEGLEPGTRYYYRIEDETGLVAGGSDHTFVTPPPFGSRVPFRFWVVGDSGTGEAQQGRVRDAMLLEARARPPDLFLHVGDIAYTDGTEEEFQKGFYRMYPNILRNTVVWPTMGNHEGGSADSLTETGPYYDGYVLPRGGEAGGLPSGSEAFYAHDYANVHFVVLESHTDELRDVDSAMLRWLEMDLAATDRDWIIVYFHHPPYTKGSHDSDVELAHIEIRERALPIMERAGVDVVLAGHSHLYERSYLVYGAYATPTTADAGVIVDRRDGKPEGDGPYHKLGGQLEDATMFVVAGHGGTNVSKDGDDNHPLMYFTEVRNGSVLVDVDGMTLSLRNVRIDGRITDSFTIVKDRGLRVYAPEPGALLAKGSTVAIAWAGAGGSGRVAIEHSKDGASWVSIGEADGQTGRFVWTPPEALGPIQIRVRDLADETVVDAIDGTVDVMAKAPVEVLRLGSRWKYEVESLDGRNWTSPTFPDAAWDEGRAKIGVCAGLPWNCGTPTYLADALLTNTIYLRRHVDVAELPTAVKLEMIYEVGAVVYVNGLELVRKSIGDESFDAFAASDAIYARVSVETIPLGAENPFVIGENVVAVMVKKGEEHRPNLSFDMAMTLLVIPPPEEESGCGCGAVGSEGALMLAVVALAVARLRRGSGPSGGGPSRRRA